MTTSTFGPAKVKFIPPKDKWGEVIEISLWYKGKPEHIWISVKFFQSSRDVVIGSSVDTSDPWNTVREDVRMIETRPLKKQDTVYITCKSPVEESEPVDKDGVRLVRGDKPVEKFTFNLNSSEEIEIIAFTKDSVKTVPDLPDAV